MVIFTINLGKAELKFERQSPHHITKVTITPNPNELPRHLPIELELDNDDLKQLYKVIDILDSY